MRKKAAFYDRELPNFGDEDADEDDPEVPSFPDLQLDRQCLGGVDVGDVEHPILKPKLVEEDAADRSEGRAGAAVLLLYRQEI